MNANKSVLIYDRLIHFATGEEQRSADSTETDPSGLLQSESQAASGSKTIPECSRATGS